MSSNVVLKEALKRFPALFTASVAVTVIAALLLWWHHTSLAGRCNHQTWRNGEPVTCSYSTSFFGDWQFLAMLALVDLVLCLAVAALWGWAKHRQMQRPR